MSAINRELMDKIEASSEIIQTTYGMGMYYIQFTDEDLLDRSGLEFYNNMKLLVKKIERYGKMPNG